MSHIARLKEHAYHLLDDADEGTVTALIKVLEAGADGRPLAFTPRSGGVGGNRNGGLVEFQPTAASTAALSDNPLVEEQKSQQTTLTNLYSPHSAQHLSESASVNYFDRRGTAISTESGVDSEIAPSNVKLEPVETALAASNRGRRAGVSAPPMAQFLQDQVAKQAFSARKIPKTEEQRQKVAKIVDNALFFAGMDTKDRVIIVDALEPEEFAPGAEILTQGQVPNPAKFYLVFEGTCEVVIDGKFIASLTPGNTFGELEMMYSTECKATIRTVTDCIMYSLDQSTYQVIVYSTSKAKREQFAHLVQQVTFLEALSDYDKTTLAEALTTKDFFEGEHLIRFGEKGENMYIIMEGEVQVVGRDKGKKVDVIRLGPDNVVGELEFLFDHSTIADVVAVTKKVKTATISRRHFEMCVGITDELKQFVAKKGNYEHYLKEADDKVKREIETLERRVKRVDAEAELRIEKLDTNGEVILTQEVGHRDNSKRVPYRYPLKPLQDRTNMLLFGVREDDTVMFWGEGMERITDFPASEVVGRSVHILMHGNKDQTTFHGAIHAATKLAGHLDEEFFEKLASNTYTIQRRDGLTKVKLSLRIVPPSVAHGRSIPEMMLVVGEEVKQPPPQVTTDYSHWVSDQIRTTINDSALQGDNKLAKINQLLVKFEKLQRSAQHIDASNMTVINLRQLVGSVVTNASGDCIDKGISINQSFNLIVEDVYCDPNVLPSCLNIAMRNCMRHLPMNSEVVISCSTVEEFSAEFLLVEFWDNGNGFPPGVIAAVNGSGARVKGSLMNLKDSVEGLGGEMSIESEPHNSRLIFKFPFVQATPDDADADTADLATSTTSTSMALTKNQTYTSLVVEEHAAYRNMIFSALWDRKHAVLTGTTWEDIQTRRELADILFIDTSQSTMCSDPSRIMELAKMASASVAVIVTGEHVSKAIEDKSSGFLTLQKPFTQKQLASALRKAEERIYKLKAEKEKINATRAAFNQNSRSAGYTLGKMLGKGAFGEVYEATDALTGGVMAVKTLRMSNSTPEQRQTVVNEIEVMCTLNHPNIIHYFFAEEDAENEQIKVIMEFASGGTLQDLMVRKGGELNMNEFVAMLRHIVEGVAYIHSQSIIHRDLKTPNVLLDGVGKGKLGDFGTAKRLHSGELLYDMTGTLQYMAPEVLSAGEIIPLDAEAVANLAPGEDLTEAHGTKLGYSFPADIWSLGCIALEMATGKPPFAHLGTMNSMASITNFITNLKDVPDLSPLFDKPPSIIEFVSACLNPDPAKRLKASQLLEHNIFQEGSGDHKSALKALKRAQLMTVLNAFVAFQEPEEVEAKKAAEEEARKARENPKAAKKAEDDFFADSSDEDEDEEDEDGSGDEKDADSDRKSPGAAAGTPDSSSPPTPRPVVAPLRFGIAVGNPNQSPFSGNLNHNKNEGSPEAPNSARARPISFGISEGVSTPRGGNPSTSGVSPTSKAAQFPSPQSPQPRPTTPPTSLGANPIGSQSAHNIIPRPPQVNAGGTQRPTTADAPTETSSAPPTVANGMADLFQPLAMFGEVAGAGANASPTSPSSAAAGTMKPNATANTATAVVGPNNTSSKSDQLIISLHDALLMLVDELTRTNSNVHTSDALKAQYDSIRKKREQTPPFSGNTNTTAAEVAKPADGAMAESVSVRGIFKPDIDRLLEDDVAFIKNVAAALSASSPVVSPTQK